jgi:predicted ATPase/DNA-binding winged helix-turn-helix (wHTH) protein
MSTLRLADGHVDLAQRLVRRGGVETVLTAQNAALLGLLVDAGGRAVARDTLAVHALGHRPGSGSRAVDHAIRRLRVKIEVEPANPSHIEGIRGVGYRFVAATRPDSGLVGRDAVLAQLEPLRGWVTLLGPGGVGKTSIARALAAGSDGLVVELAAARTADQVALEVARALGVPGQTPDLVGQVALALADLPAPVVVLDDVEHVAAQIGALVARWSRPDRLLLVTSRERVGHRDERVVEIAPLADPDAMTLFQSRVPPGVTVPPDQAAPLVATLDGLPLALELAAAWMDLVDPDQLAGRVHARLRTLSARRRDRPDRHGSLESVLDGSWELLTRGERTALGRLAQLTGSFDLAAAEAAIEADPVVLPALVHLGRLRDKSLLALEPGPRYRVLGLVRAYAARAHGPDPDAVRRIAAHYTGWVQANRGDLDAMGVELVGIRGAQRACVDVDPVQAGTLVRALHGYDWGHALPAEALERARSVGRALPPDAHDLAARMVWCEAQWLSRADGIDAAREALSRARALAKLADDANLTAGIELQSGIYATFQGDHAVAEPLLRSALATFDAAGRTNQHATAAMLLGQVLRETGRAQAGHTLLLRAVDLALQGGEPTRICDALRFLAEHEISLGQLEQADSRYVDALTREAPGSFGHLLTVQCHTELQLLRGQLDDAERTLVQAQQGDRLDSVAAANASELAGLLAWLRGDPSSAMAHLERAQHAYQHVGRHQEVAGCLAARCGLLARTDVDAARALWESQPDWIAQLEPDIRAAWRHHWDPHAPPPQGGCLRAQLAVRLLDAHD